MGFGRFCSRACGFASHRTAENRTCEQCGQPFTVLQARLKKAEGNGRFCSMACYTAQRRASVERQCEECGASFTVRADTRRAEKQRFCSLPCARTNRGRTKVTLTCPQCGGTFKEAPSRSDRVYCSWECKSASQMNHETRYCANCGEGFAVTPSKIASGLGRFCCRACYLQANAPVRLTCATCGKPFTVPPSMTKRKYPAKFCSVACFGRGQRRANHFGRGHIPYRKWREAVLARDGYRCRQCGTTSEPLNAHHIKGWTRYPALRFDVSNGLTLCEPCHNSVHSKYFHVYHLKR
jgi:5-methylcytosine-specific restriction endonuclease McrA